jgi:hypothetical protein
MGSSSKQQEMKAPLTKLMLTRLLKKRKKLTRKGKEMINWTSMKVRKISLVHKNWRCLSEEWELSWKKYKRKELRKM